MARLTQFVTSSNAWINEISLRDVIRGNQAEMCESAVISSASYISESALPGASEESRGLPVVGRGSFMSFFINGTSLVSLNSDSGILLDGFVRTEGVSSSNHSARQQGE